MKGNNWLPHRTTRIACVLKLLPCGLLERVDIVSSGPQCTYLRYRASYNSPLLHAGIKRPAWTLLRGAHYTWDCKTNHDSFDNSTIIILSWHCHFKYKRMPWTTNRRCLEGQGTYANYNEWCAEMKFSHLHLVDEKPVRRILNVDGIFYVFPYATWWARCYIPSKITSPDLWNIRKKNTDVSWKSCKASSWFFVRLLAQSRGPTKPTNRPTARGYWYLNLLW